MRQMGESLRLIFFDRLFARSVDERPSRALLSWQLGYEMMRIWPQKLIATFAAVVVLLSSINCFCSTMQGTGCHADGDQDNSCRPHVDKCGDDDRCSDEVPNTKGDQRPGEKDHHCPHCQGTMNLDKDQSQASNLRPTALEFGLISSGIGQSGHDLFVLLNLRIEPKFSSPTASPTLLRLHCALTI
jgi:hypothetical protein